MVGASGSPASASASPHERITSPDATRGSKRSRCAGDAEARDRQCGADERGDRRHRRHRTPALLDQHGELGEALPHAALLARHRDAEQVRARERGPERGVEVQLAALDLAQAIRRRLLFEDLARELAQLALDLGGCEVH